MKILILASLIVVVAAIGCDESDCQEITWDGYHDYVVSGTTEFSDSPLEDVLVFVCDAELANSEIAEIIADPQKQASFCRSESTSAGSASTDELGVFEVSFGTPTWGSEFQCPDGISKDETSFRLDIDELFLYAWKEGYQIAKDVVDTNDSSDISINLNVAKTSSAKH